MSPQDPKMRSGKTLNLSMVNPHTFIASVIWGAIGLGILAYGTREKSIVPFLGGVVLLAISYFVGGAWVMSLCGLVVLGLLYLFRGVLD